MEFQSIINLLGNRNTQPYKFRNHSNNQVEKHNGDCGTSYANSQINFKSTIFKLNFCAYSNAFILDKKIITVTANAHTEPDKTNKQVISETVYQTSNYIVEINNTKKDNTKYLNFRMLMIHLLKFKW